MTVGDLVLDVAAVSDRGNVRDENQDVFGIVALPYATGCGIVVADGMGGHVGGARAARAAVAAACGVLGEPSGPAGSLDGVFQEADAAVRTAREGPGLSGTTLVIAVVSPDRTLVGNIGDSRAYVMSNGHARQLTLDHSALAEHLRAGGDASESAGLPGRNLLTRAVTGEGAPADFFEWRLVPSETLLLCTDGLWGSLPDSELYRMLSSQLPLATLADRACDAALAAGSTDNVTLALCRVRAPARRGEPPGERAP